ncbi:hypothetical protein RUMCAL_02094 [Ruminococcus callidus ATCC 27760]|uniref:Uncharacterized protein n=1 Tax=Ruminococcus callidus ATCC 27760 TaxID=411473 RepID=U2LXE4_9FIRM|nr:hypothetical protein RUMCAL_02094 [Ruminococcus callidus ATCC 27760]
MCNTVQDPAWRLCAVLLMESLNLTMCVAGNAARMSACRLYARSVCLYVVFLCNYMFFTNRKCDYSIFALIMK